MMQNPFIWHDLMTSDVDAAKAFYASVVGWCFETQSPDYHVVKTNDAGVGGIMPTPAQLEGMSPFWSGYIYVADVDAACAKITKLGGKIAMGPHQVPGGNWIVSAIDPQGGLFQLTSTTQ
jgi:uncharacterized protein